MGTTRKKKGILKIAEGWLLQEFDCTPLDFSVILCIIAFGYLLTKFL